MGTRARIEGGLMESGPGKFEGEPRYAEHYWNKVLEGCADREDVDEDGRPVALFKINETDVQLFPELADVERLMLWEDEFGFVYTATN